MPTTQAITLVTDSLTARRATPGKSKDNDLALPDDCLTLGSRFLLRKKQNVNTPQGWSDRDWNAYSELTRKERLIEAATLIIAQIDVLITKGIE